MNGVIVNFSEYKASTVKFYLVPILMELQEVDPARIRSELSTSYKSRIRVRFSTKNSGLLSARIS
jgi:hypothetical protein